MTNLISDRSRNISSFIAMEILEKAQKMEALGHRVIQLQLGEPDFETPEVIKEAHARAMADNHTHYTPSLGDTALKATLAEYYRTRYGVTISPERFMICPGSSLGLAMLCGAILNPGDRVIISDPCYPCYDNMISYHGAVPIRLPVREAEGFLYRPEEIKSSLEPSAKAIIINSPANPTGTILDEERLRRIASLGPLVISDEIYHGLTYGPEPSHSILEYTDNAVVVSGFSKLFAMTGWRLGYLILPPDPELLRTMLVLTQNFLLSTSAAVQKAGICALTSAWPEVEQMRQTYDRRRQILLAGLKRLDFGVKVEPTGAFYILANASHLSTDSYSLAFDILEKVGVATDPGIDFGPGSEGFLRFSYASSEANLEEALARLGHYLEDQP